MSYSVNSVWVYGVYTENADIIDLGVTYGGMDWDELPQTPLTERIQALDAIFGHLRNGSPNFGIHAEGDWAAGEFWGAVLGLRINDDLLNDLLNGSSSEPFQRLQSLQLQALPYIEELRRWVPGASQDIKMHKIEQAG